MSSNGNYYRDPRIDGAMDTQMSQPQPQPIIQPPVPQFVNPEPQVNIAGLELGKAPTPREQVRQYVRVSMAEQQSSYPSEEALYAAYADQARQEAWLKSKGIISGQPNPTTPAVQQIQQNLGLAVNHLRNALAIAANPSSGVELHQLHEFLALMALAVELESGLE